MLEWSKEQNKYRNAILKLSEKLNEEIVEFDNNSQFSHDKWKLICQANIPAIPVDEQYNGIGLDVLTSMFLLEGLGYACEDAGLNFTVSSHIVSTEIPIQKFGTKDQKKKYLPRLCDGKIIGAHAITEPNTGSDAFNMQTTATKKDDKYILNGSKVFISNSPIADVFIVYAATRKDRGALGNITAFIVEKETPGLKLGSSIEKMGLRTSPTGEIFFDDCEVPEENVLGKVGSGFSIFNYVMKWEILLSFAINLGEMERLIEKCITYSKTRQQFDQLICKYQSIANKIVDMKVNLEASKSLLYKAGQKFQRGKNCSLDISIAKLFVSEAFVQASLDAIQIFGAYGYTKEYLVEKNLRNSVAGKIYSGTSEIQKNIIANHLGL